MESEELQDGIMKKSQFFVAGFGFDPDHPSTKERYLNKFDANVTRCPPRKKKVSATPLKSRKKEINDLICMKETDANACEGDSGSGLIARGKRGLVIIHGVVAHGTDCKLMYARDVQRSAGVEVNRTFGNAYFTSTVSHLPFICAAMQNSIKLVTTSCALARQLRDAQNTKNLTLVI